MSRFVDRFRLAPEDRRNLRAFGRFLLSYRSRLVWAGVAMFLGVALQLPMPFLTMFVVDRLVETKDVGLFPLICVGLVAIVLSNAFVILVHRLLLALLREHALGTLQLQLVERLQNARMAYFYRHASSYLSTRLRSDLMSISQLLAGPLLEALQSALLLVGGVVSMFVLSVPLALVCLALMPIFALSVVFFNRRVRALALRVQESRSVFGKTLQESLASVQLIKAFGAARHERRRIRGGLLSLIHDVLLLEMTSSVARRLIYMFGMIAPITILWVGIGQYLSGAMSLGQFVGFHSLLGFVFTPMQSLLGQNLQFQSALVSLRRVMEILELESEPEAIAPAASPGRFDLAFDDVHFGYRADGPVLRGLDLRVAHGEVVAVVGPSGGGKTTLLRLALRFHEPDRGRVLLGGVDVRQLELDSYRSRFAIVFQEPYLLSGSIAENLRIARPDASLDDLERAATLACAHEFVAALPKGYDTKIGEGGATLSAGQKIRLAIARALLRDAPVLLLDEPTSALDPETEGRLLANLRRYLAGRTALIISHQQAPTTLADRIVAVRGGRVTNHRSEERDLSGPSVRDGRLAANVN